MTFLMFAALGVLLVAATHLAIGWFLANGLREQLFSVREHPPDPPGIRVQAFDGHRITLASERPRQDIGHPGTTAIVFDTGGGRLGDVVASDGQTVTRSVVAMSGVPSPGDLVRLEPYVFLEDPSELGLSYSETTYPSELGDIGAWEIEGNDPSRWAVHVHGWTAHRQEAMRVLPTFHASRFNSFVIDYRNDPGAPRDPSGFYRFGLTEWKDLEAAVDLVIKRGATEIVLTGYSTGGALIMGFLENSAIAQNVSAVVLDSPNIILAEAIRHGSQNVRATHLMIEFGLWIADLRWKVDWEGTNYVHRADQFLNVPTLVFHGTSDHRVPISVSRQLEARVPDQVQLVEIPAAGHVMSWNADPENYEQYLASFLRRV